MSKETLLCIMLLTIFVVADFIYIAEVKHQQKDIIQSVNKQLQEYKQMADKEKYKRELCVSTFGASENGNHQNQSSSAKHKAHSLGDPG